MYNTDIQERPGFFADLCLRHGADDPYQSITSSLEAQGRLQAYEKAIQAYEKAIQGAYYEVTASSHHARYHETLAQAWLSRARPTDDLNRLEEAATSGNEVAFTQALTEINWNSKAAADYIRAIDLALQVGAHLAARKLAMDGAELHFNSEELQKYSRVLAPPKLLTEPHQTSVQPKANTEWLQANRNNYKGQWVALQNGVFIASAKTYKALMAHIGDVKDRGILVTPVY